MTDPEVRASEVGASTGPDARDPLAVGPYTKARDEPLTLTQWQQSVVAAIVCGEHVTVSCGSMAQARRIYAEALRQVEAASGSRVTVIRPRSRPM